MDVTTLRARLENVDGDRTVKIVVEDHGIMMVHDLHHVTDNGNSPAHDILWLEVR